jgi:hypothetical protein
MKGSHRYHAFVQYNQVFHKKSAGVPALSTILFYFVLKEMGNV